MGSGECSTMRNFIFCTVHLIVRVIKCIRLRWAGHIARIKEGSSVFEILTGTLTGKSSLGRFRRRWKANIKFDLKEIGINTKNLVDSALDRDYWNVLVNVALNLLVP